MVVSIYLKSKWWQTFLMFFLVFFFYLKVFELINICYNSKWFWCICILLHTQGFDSLCFSISLLPRWIMWCSALMMAISPPAAMTAVWGCGRSIATNWSCSSRCSTRWGSTLRKYIQSSDGSDPEETAAFFPKQEDHFQQNKEKNLILLRLKKWKPVTEVITFFHQGVSPVLFADRWWVPTWHIISGFNHSRHAFEITHCFFYSCSGLRLCVLEPFLHRGERMCGCRIQWRHTKDLPTCLLRDGDEAASPSRSCHCNPVLC